MHKLFKVFAVVVMLSAGMMGFLRAENINLQPKYGHTQKTDAQRAADRQFVESMDRAFNGDRKKAANAVAARGWQQLQAGRAAEALKRFNQAWMLDSRCGYALWGMGAVQVRAGKAAEGLRLLAEAEALLPDDIDLQADYAKALSEAGMALKDRQIADAAFSRFAKVHRRNPNHTMNLQNWSIAHFMRGEYAKAWEKIKLAEATPRGGEVDKRYLGDLQQKMARPR